jgi:DNA-binding response OmpR family regulator
VRPGRVAIPLNGSSNNRIVLLVEDSDDDAFFFERAFEMAKTGARLVRLIDGGAAVEYLERASSEFSDFSQCHLVFLDLKLPVLSGFDVLQWIRERGLTVEVIVLSGSDLESDINFARQLGASDYLVKPISPAEISKCVAQIANGHEC